MSVAGPGALSWLPAHWVSADRPGPGRFGGPRRLALAAESRTDQAELAHPSAPSPNSPALYGPITGYDDDDQAAALSDVGSYGDGPVLVSAWDKTKRGVA